LTNELIDTLDRSRSCDHYYFSKWKL